MRRFRIDGLVAVGALALIALTPAPAPRSLELAGAPETARVGIISTGAGTTLVRLNSGSLKRAGRPLELNAFGGVWAFAPDGRLLAMAVRPTANSSFETLRFFTVAGPRRARGRISLGGAAAALFWLRPDRILAYVNEPPTGASSVVAIDPGARRVVARTRVDGSVMHVARAGDGLVLLVSETNRIGAARVVLVDGNGATRTAKLDAIVAGTSWPEGATSDPIGRREIPGLAVDESGRRAVVIAPSGLAAEVDLASLAVSVHHLSEPRALVDRIAGWLTPAAEAKGMNGPALTAAWLGDGLLAVAGTDESAALEGGAFHGSARPLGLRIVDTHDWSVRLLDPGADSFTVAEDVLLATGSSWSSDSQQQTGMGVVAYAADRTPRFRLLSGHAAWIGFVYRGRAYISVHNESALRIVDLLSGRVVGSRSAYAPWPLLGESSPVFR